MSLRLIGILLPLLLYPYLLRTLGTENFGVSVYIQTIIHYGSVVLNFGFNISATRKIVLYANDKKKLLEFITSVYYIKFGLFLCVVGILFLVVLLDEYLINYILVFAGMAVQLVWELIMPVWYFQGINRIEIITKATILSRCVLIVMVLFMVNNEDDLILYSLAYGISLLIGLIYVIVALRNEGLRFVKTNFHELKSCFKESLPIFLSTASVQVYMNSNKFVIGRLFGMTSLTFYDLGEKLLNMLKLVPSVLGQATFPTFSKNRDLKEINSYMLITFVVTSILTLGVLFFLEELIVLIASEDMLLSVEIISVLLLSAIPVSISQFLGTSRLVVFGYSKVFSRIIIQIGFIYVVMLLIFLFSNVVTMKGLCWMVVFIEISVVVIMYRSVVKLKLLS